MTTLLNTQTPLDQLDRELQDLTRDRGRVFDLSQFRRYLDTADQCPPRTSAEPTRASTAARPESQLRHELNLAVTDLGAATFVLAHHGTATDPRLAHCIRHIHNLYAQLDAITHAA